MTLKIKNVAKAMHDKRGNLKLSDAIVLDKNQWMKELTSRLYMDRREREDTKIDRIRLVYDN